MNKVQTVAHDLALILAELPMNTPNRSAIFIHSLESFSAFAQSEAKVAHLLKPVEPRIDQLLADSKKY